MIPILFGVALLVVTLFLTCAEAGNADRRGFPHSRGKYNSYTAWICGREN
jgi:hypothetical protein